MPCVRPCEPCERGRRALRLDPSVPTLENLRQHIQIQAPGASARFTRVTRPYTRHSQPPSQSRTHLVIFLVGCHGLVSLSLDGRVDECACRREPRLALAGSLVAGSQKERRETLAVAIAKSAVKLKDEAKMKEKRAREKRDALIQIAGTEWLNKNFKKNC